MRTISLVYSMPLLAVAACGGDELVDRMGSTSQRLISDAVHGGGTPGFYFLAPLVPSPSPSGTFEPNSRPVVVVQELDSLGSPGATVAQWSWNWGLYTSTEYFQVSWKTYLHDLSVDKTYRIRVFVPGGRELGFADIDVVSAWSEWHHVDTTQYVPLVDDEILPIRFRIERQAVDGDGDGMLDWKDNCPTVANPYQADYDGDRRGDACECLGVVCPAGPCELAGVCSSKTGACSASSPAPDGAACEDGNVCTTGDACIAGTCTSGASTSGCP